jgi:major membrane immunogen (membrane-anchored lipoprotein)
MTRFTMCFVAVAGLVLLTACGESPQSSKTAGKDVAPYQGTTNGFATSGWKPGEKTSWELSLKSRAQNTQNEYSRTQ